MTAAETKELWAKTNWSNPIEGIDYYMMGLWDYLYDVERLPEVIEQEFKYVQFIRYSFSKSGANEDANEMLSHMDKFWQSKLLVEWYKAHKAEADEGYNQWWWSNHDINDYVDEEGVL